MNFHLFLIFVYRFRHNHYHIFTFKIISTSAIDQSSNENGELLFLCDDYFNISRKERLNDFFPLISHLYLQFQIHIPLHLHKITCIATVLHSDKRSNGSKRFCFPVIISMDLKKRVFFQIASSYRGSDIRKTNSLYLCSLFEGLMVQGASACVSFTISMGLREKKTSFSLYHHHQRDGEKKKRRKKKFRLF